MNSTLSGWDRLRHHGLLIDAQRLQTLSDATPPQLLSFRARELRKNATAIIDEGNSTTEKRTAFISFVLEQICGFGGATGKWHRGPQVPADWGRIAVTGESIKPRHLWQGAHGAILPVFIDREKRIGIGRGRKTYSQVLQWLRAGDEQLAVLTNGRQWRLVFAGLDFDAWCEWDTDLWLEEGELSTQVTALRTLLQPELWIPESSGSPCRLLTAIQDSRKGQAELSQVLGERVREAVELLIQAHGEAIKEECSDVDPADIYRAAVRVVMRLVVILFAESRELLPRDNALYHAAYGINGLLEELEKTASRGGNRLKRSHVAWPRVLALFHLVHEGSHHPSLPVPAYGGDLFAPGDQSADDGLTKALAVFETACFTYDGPVDSDVHAILDRITRTRIKLRQGRTSTWMPAPVDFSDLSSEYIGILYEGLLDFELKTAPDGDPIIFLAIGKQPALPLSRLQDMDDKALKNLLESLKKSKASDSDEEPQEEDVSEVETEESDATEEEDTPAVNAADGAGQELQAEAEDERLTTRSNAEAWARRAVVIGGLAKRPRGKKTPEKELVYQEIVARKARQLVARVVLPGEWYLVLWGGTRKGSGAFYTRPGLAIPLVQRTLRPLAWVPPTGSDGEPEIDAPPLEWAPKKPEEILDLKVVDPACGSGTFPVAAARFLTDSLYASLHHHGRITEQSDRSLIALFGTSNGSSEDGETLSTELLPCPPDDEYFEPRLKAVLKRHVVERCIYGVDLDPLAVELCRLALWIETMDRSLPFSFLDHKIKCGNALVGAWFDQFQHYPAMAWKNREGGDKSHSNGVHFKKGAQTKAIKSFVKDVLTPDLADTVRGQRHLIAQDTTETLSVHADALELINKLHSLPIMDAGGRATLYRNQLIGAEAWQRLHFAMDQWCACWFWPVDELANAPLPSDFASPTQATAEMTAAIARTLRFFHWELEFPDVFHVKRSGFHAVIGNPPWDRVKPDSKAFFSNEDPMYRGLAKPEIQQTKLFSDLRVESAWIKYLETVRQASHYFRHVSAQASMVQGDQQTPKLQPRASTYPNCDPSRDTGPDLRLPPYHLQGKRDVNLYKLFTEQSHFLLQCGGRLGFILPAGIYSDDGNADLRELLIEHSQLEWLFGFTNRRSLFPIDTRFAFCCLITQKDGSTRTVATAFGRQELSEWMSPAPQTLAFNQRDLHLFSPTSKTIPELQTQMDLEALRSIYDGSVMADPDGGWPVKYRREFDMTTDRRKGLIKPFDQTITAAATQTTNGQWAANGTTYLPLYTGKMIEQYDYAFQRWESGHGKYSKWTTLPLYNKSWAPEFVIRLEDQRHRWRGGTRLVFRDITMASNERTAIAAVIPAWPCGNKVPILMDEDHAPLESQLAMCAVMNSFVFDYVVRCRMTGINLNKFILNECPLPDLSKVPEVLPLLAARLALPNKVFALSWLELRDRFPVLETANWTDWWAIDIYDRTILRATIEAMVASLFGISESQLEWILRDCNTPSDSLAKRDFRSILPAKGFWRIGIGTPTHSSRHAWHCPPNLRLPSLTLVAFQRLKALELEFSEQSADPNAMLLEVAENGTLFPSRCDWSCCQDDHVDVKGAATWEDCEEVAAELTAIWQFEVTDSTIGRSEPDSTTSDGASVVPSLFQDLE